MGTGSLLHQIADRYFIIATCAHNFITFKKIQKRNEQNKVEFTNQVVQASTDGTTFYLQRDGDSSKMEMRVIEIAVHPDYLQDG